MLVERLFGEPREGFRRDWEDGWLKSYSGTGSETDSLALACSRATARCFVTQRRRKGNRSYEEASAQEAT